MVTNNLAALYGFRVQYLPPTAQDMRYGKSGYGHIEVLQPSGKAWGDVWERASRTEKVRYCRWSANVICRVWAGLVKEAHNTHAVALTLSGSITDAVDPLNGTEDPEDYEYWPACLTFNVESCDAKQWMARTHALINEVIASDAAILAMPNAQPEEHAGPALADTTTTTTEEQEPHR